MDLRSILDDVAVVAENLRNWACAVWEPQVRVRPLVAALALLALALLLAMAFANQGGSRAAGVLILGIAVSVIAWHAYETRRMALGSTAIVQEVRRQFVVQRRPDLRVWVHDCAESAWWIFAVMNVGSTIALDPQIRPEWLDEEDVLDAPLADRPEMCKIGTVAANHAAQPHQMYYFALKALVAGGVLRVEWRDSMGEPLCWRRWRAVETPSHGWTLQPLDACPELQEGD